MKIIKPSPLEVIYGSFARAMGLKCEGLRDLEGKEPNDSKDGILLGNCDKSFEKFRFTYQGAYLPEDRPRYGENMVIVKRGELGLGLFKSLEKLPEKLSTITLWMHSELRNVLEVNPEWVSEVASKFRFDKDWTPPHAYLVDERESMLEEIGSSNIKGRYVNQGVQDYSLAVKILEILFPKTKGKYKF